MISLRSPSLILAYSEVPEDQLPQPKNAEGLHPFCTPKEDSI